MREYINLVGLVFLLSLIFYPFELLLPAEKGQPLAKRLLNLAYVPFFLALAMFVLQPRENESPPSGLRDGKESRPVSEATIAPMLAWYRTSSRQLKRISRYVF